MILLLGIAANPVLHVRHYFRSRATRPTLLPLMVPSCTKLEIIHGSSKQFKGTDSLFLYNLIEAPRYSLCSRLYTRIMLVIILLCDD